jgi:hypothetical protein
MRNIAKKREVPDQEMARIAFLAPPGVPKAAQAKPPPGLY